MSSSPKDQILHRDATLGAMSSPADRTSDMKVYNDSFEEIRYSLWVDKSKTLALEEKIASEIGAEVTKVEEKNPVKKKVWVVKKVVKKMPKRVHYEESNVESVMASNESRNSDSNIVNTHTIKNGDQRRVVRKNVVAKGWKRVKKEENVGGLGIFEAGDETNTESPKNIVSSSSEFGTPSYDIFTDKEDKTRVARKKVVKKGTKRVKSEENAGELGRGGVRNEAETERGNVIEFENLGSSTDDTSVSYNFDDGMDKNVGKEKTTESALTKSRKRVLKEECSEELGKLEAGNEVKSESPEINVLGEIKFETPASDIANSRASISIESDYNACGLVAVENVNVDTDNANKNETIVRVVRKKVVTKGSKRVKKEQPFEKQGKIEVVNVGEFESHNALERRTLNSDIANSCVSNLPGDKNHGSDVDDMETEKVNFLYDASHNVNTNAKKEENNVRFEKPGSEASERIEGEKHEAESCDVGAVKRDFTMEDDVVLSAEMEALVRRKWRKNQIFLSGLDKDAVEEDVRKVFQEMGEIVEVTVKMNEKSGKNKGFAFLRYASAADAKKAVEKSGKIEIFGKPCSVEFMKGNDTLYLGNIDKTWKNEDIVKLLQEAGVGKIDKVTIKPDPEKPECNVGYAFLELETIRDAQITFGLLEKKSFLGNKKIRVEWAKQLSEADEEEMHKVKTVYAEYLPASWDEEAVKDHFKKFGEIDNVILARNLVTSKRKDFAFVNYKTREAAIACIKAFTHESSHNEDSKVRIKVYLAKSTPKTKQVKHAPNPVIKISNKEKPTAAQKLDLVQSNPLGSNAVSTSHYYDNNRVVVQPQLRSKGEFTSHHCDNNRGTNSTNDELVQLLREQASWRQPQTSLGIGSAGFDYTHSLPARKRQYFLGDPNYSDLRGYPRPRTETAFPSLNPSVLHPDLRIQSLPHYHRQGLSSPSGLPYEVDYYFSRSQTRGGASSLGGGSSVHHGY